MVLSAVIERFVASFGQGDAILLPEDAIGTSLAAYCGLDPTALEPAPLARE